MMGKILIPQHLVVSDLGSLDARGSSLSVL